MEDYIQRLSKPDHYPNDYRYHNTNSYGNTDSHRYPYTFTVAIGV